MKRTFIVTLFITLILSLTACQPRYRNYVPHLDQSEINKVSLSLAHEGVQVVRVGDTLRVILPADYFFDPNSDKVITARSITLKQIVALIESYGHKTVKVYGYSDNTGTETHQYKLSYRRAYNIAAFLWHEGIPYRQLYIVGYGPENAVASNQILPGSAANRRIEIRVGRS